MLSLARLSQVITLLAVAIFLALGLDPVVRFLQRRGLSRGWAVAVVFLASSACSPRWSGCCCRRWPTQGTDLANNAPAYVESLLRNKQVRSLDEHYHVVSKLQEQMKAKLSDGQSGPTSSAACSGPGGPR